MQGHRDGGQPFALHGYAVIVPLGAPALRVHDRAFWVQRARLSAEALLPADRELFALLPPSTAVAPCLEPRGCPGGCTIAGFQADGDDDRV